MNEIVKVIEKNGKRIFNGCSKNDYYFSILRDSLCLIAAIKILFFL